MPQPREESLVQALYRHNRESEAEAIEIMRDQRRGFLQNLRGCWSSDPHVRRASALRVSLGVPGVFRLLGRYVIRGGFVGSYSFDRAALEATREHWIEMKVREREKSWRVETDALVSRLLQERVQQ
jgi:hypothetical protein